MVKKPTIDNIKSYIVGELKLAEKGSTMTTFESVADNVFHLLSLQHDIINLTNFNNGEKND